MFARWVRGMLIGSATIHSITSFEVQPPDERIISMSLQQFRRAVRGIGIAGIIILTTAISFSNSRGEEKQNFSRWEKAIAAFEEQDRQKPPPKNAILFVGSSSIRHWKLDNSFPDLQTLNRGFGGSQIVESIHFAKRIILKHEPRIVALYAGDNDISAGKSPKQVAADFKHFVKTVRDELPQTRIIFIAIKPSIKRWNLAEKMKTANALIERQCREDKLLVYLDVFTPMLGEDGKPRPELFIKDGLHLNETGYKLWAATIKQYLK
jgi:lysophospholipase L1-like esterase